MSGPKRPPKLVELTVEQHHRRQTPRVAIAQPVALRRHVGLTDEGGPLGAVVEGFTEALRRMGYTSTARVTPSPFGGWDVVVAVQPVAGLP